MTQEIHVFDIGTSFELTVYEDETVVNISSATTLEVLFQKPDGTVDTKTGVFLTDGTDGTVQYVTVSNDLNQTGTWKVQARVEFPTGTWSSDIQKFKVYANLDS